MRCLAHLVWLGLLLSGCARFGWERAVPVESDGAVTDATLLDASHLTTDAGGADTTSADTTADGPFPDAKADSLPPDVGSVDTTADGPAPDTTKDTLAPDTTQDTLAPDTTQDTLAPDTTHDTLTPDTTVDSGTAVPGNWATIPAGNFSMGSPSGEACRWSDEVLHLVTLTNAFEIQTTEVTQGQYQTVVGSNPSADPGCGESCPVENLTWHMAAAYCNALSALSEPTLTACYTCAGEGSGTTCSLKAAYAQDKVYLCPGYRLPTEAEWEYAYRAKTGEAFYSGPADDRSCGKCRADTNGNAIGWNCSNASTINPVAQKTPNGWGLFDMAGNVWEWTQDWYQADLGAGAAVDPWGAPSGSDKVTRGASFDRFPDRSRAAFRGTDAPSFGGPNVGVRCVRTLP